MHKCENANAFQERRDGVRIKGYLEVDWDCLSWHYQVKYVERRAQEAGQVKAKNLGQNLCLTCSFSGLLLRQALCLLCHELLNISSFFGCKVASLSLLRTSNKHFAKLNGHVRQAHVCRGPWVLRRLLCNFAQNILDIMSHLREDGAMWLYLWMCVLHL